MLVTIYQNTQYHISEDNVLNAWEKLFFKPIFLYHANVRIKLVSGMKSIETNIVTRNKMVTNTNGNI
jgi:hypothetical protein